MTAIGLVSTYIAVKGPASFTIIYDKFVGFITAAILMSFVQAVWWYVSSFWGDKLLALGGNSGNVFYDVGLTVLTRKAAGDLIFACLLVFNLVFHWS